MTAESPQNQVSPEATGGAGTIEEYSLGAVALARLLTGDLLPGLTAPLATVALQRRVAGNTLDDLVLRSGTDVAAAGIDYQIKRTASPTKSDDAFVDAIGQCLETMRQHRETLAAGRLQLGLGASDPRGPLEQLQRLTEIARSHATAATFLGVLVPGATAENVRTRHTHVKNAIVRAAVLRGEMLDGVQLDELTYDLLKYLRVWIFEVGDDGRDVLDATSRLATVLPPGGPEAHAVFSELRAMAESWGPNAGVIDTPMLRAALNARGYPLTADPHHQSELGRVLDASRQELDRTVDQMGGRLRLERTPPAHELGEAIQAGGIVLVSGAAGVGKSVLSRRAVQGLGEGATVVAINLTTRSGDTLATVQQELGVPHLKTVLATAATTGPRILLIDGAEHALTDAGRLLESLLDAAPTDGVSSPPWTVVITSRVDAAGPLAERLGGRLTTHIQLDELSDPEVDEVRAAFPSLAPLLRHPRSTRLLRRPYLVDLLVRSQASPGEGDVLGEEDVMAVVHKKVVRRSEGLVPGLGSPHDRGVAWSQLGEAVIAGTGSSRLSDADGTAVGGLVSDDVFRQTRSTYRFAHDVLADYATAMRLGDEDGPALLEAANTPRSLIRAVRLSLQRQLADVAHDAAEVRRVWTAAQALASNLSARDGSRWEDVPYEALISLGDPEPVLAALMSEMMAEDGAGLSRLLDVTSRYATTSQQDPSGDALQIDDVLAAPIVAFIGTLADRLPERLTELATRLVRRWLVSLEMNGREVTAFISDPTTLSAVVAVWAADDWYSERYEAALAVVGLLGEHLSPGGRALLDRAAARGHDLDVVAEDPEVAAALARDNPDLLLELAGSYYLDLPLTLDPEVPARRPARAKSQSSLWHARGGLSGYEDEDGVRRHSHHAPRRMGFGRLAGPDWGPFAALLAASPAHGLRLVGAVVDAASDARIRVEESFRDPPEPVRLALKLPHWDEAATYSGPGTAWGWYRRSGTGAYPAMSALLALRAWAKVQLATRPLADVLDDVLSVGASVAFPAVAYSLLVSDLAAAGDMIDVFLEHSDVWDLEIGRVLGEGLFSYPADDQTALRVTPDQVVSWLVLTGDAERRAALKAVGERLLATAREALGGLADDDPRMAVPLRRALNFDSDAYRATASTTQPGMIEISLEVPEGIQEELARGGGRAATLSLTLNNHMFAAMKLRDGEATEPSAAELYAQVQETLQAISETPGADPLYGDDDARALVAAAVVVRAAAGDDDARALLPEAVKILMEIGGETQPEPESYRSSRDMSWDMGADRSAATALPLILLGDELLTASDVVRPDIAAAMERLATSTSQEVHQRLTNGLADVWAHGCTGEEAQQAKHATAMAVYREWLLSAGMGPSNGLERPRVHLSEPLTEALAQPDGFDLPAAADALAGLTAAASCGCEHGETARATLATLVEHDLRAWPEEWARELYLDADTWRSQLDSWVATQILAGDDTLLEQYLDGFAAVPEQLTDLLATLANQALSPEQGVRLFTIWPAVLDRLLPGGRHVPEAGEDRAYKRDAADLDQALLPKRPEGAQWPLQAWVQGLVRWMDAFAPRPSLADRLMECLGSFGHFTSADGVGLILRMLGTDAPRILRDSRYVTHWLRIVLVERTDGLDAHRPALRQLLDDLAAQGSPHATQIQRELEA